MGALEDVLANVSQNIGYIVTIIGTGALAVRFIAAEIKKRADRLDKKIMGPEGNAQDGEGGAIDNLRQEIRKEMKAMEDRINVKVDKSQQELLFEYRQTSQKINFLIVNFGRAERSLEKLTDGRYTAARLQTNKEDGFNDDDNPNPNHDGGVDTYNKRRTRN